MNVSKKAHGLRCALCRRGLLATYNVYDVPKDEFGACGEPVPYADVKGYLFTKGSRSGADTMEIAGKIAGNTDGDRRMIAFEPVCRVDNLVEADGVFYRITAIRRVHSICLVMDLEVYPYEHQD